MFVCATVLLAARDDSETNGTDHTRPSTHGMKAPPHAQKRSLMLQRFNGSITHRFDRALNVDNVGFSGADPTFQPVDLCVLSRLGLQKAADLGNRRVVWRAGTFNR